MKFRDGILIGLLLCSGFLGFSAPVWAEEALPSFLPKDYKVTDILRGVWQENSIIIGKELALFLPNHGVLVFQEFQDPSSWEYKQKDQKVFKMKLEASTIIRNEPDLNAQVPVKLWFENGQSIEMKVRPPESVFPKVPDMSFAGHTPWNEKDDQAFEPTGFYKVAEILSHAKPVALTQDKKVFLLQAPFSEETLQEYQEFIRDKQK